MLKKRIKERKVRFALSIRLAETACTFVTFFYHFSLPCLSISAQYTRMESAKPRVGQLLRLLCRFFFLFVGEHERQRKGETTKGRLSLRRLPGALYIFVQSFFMASLDTFIQTASLSRIIRHPDTIISTTSGCSHHLECPPAGYMCSNALDTSTELIAGASEGINSSQVDLTSRLGFHRALYVRSNIYWNAYITAP